MRRVRNMLALSGLMLASVSAHADDLGVHGKTYEIIEPDIRAVMMRQVFALDADKIQREMEDSARNYTDDLPDYPLGVRRTTRTYHVNIEITVDKPIYRPVLDDDGNMEWEVMVEKGTKANPLKKLRPTTAYLVFNGKSEQQRQFAVRMWREAPNYIVPMMSAGDPAEMAKEIDAPVYRASPFILKRFDLENAPALARVGEGRNKHKIAVTEFAPPFSVERARQHVSLRKMFSSDAEIDNKRASGLEHD